MLPALLYLRLTSFRNWLRKNLRQLRQPKYVLYTAVGAAYFWFFFFRRIGGVRPARGMNTLPVSAVLGGADSADLSTALATVGGLALFGICALFAWILPKEKPGLLFTEAEVAFLFPAPITRRALVHFRLITAQLRLMFTALFFALVSNRWSFLGGNAAMHAVGWWIILSALHFHFMGAAFTVTRLIEGGVSTLRRRLIVSGTVAVLAAAAIASVWNDAPDIDDFPGGPFSSFLRWLAAWIDAGALHWVLWPFKAVVAPFLAADAGGFFLALLPAVLLLVAHYFWVMRMEVGFEEASVMLSEKRAARLATLRAGGSVFVSHAKRKGRRPPFALARPGRPEFAFLWKNLLASRPYFTPKVFAVLAVLSVGGTTLLHRLPDRSLGTSLLVVTAIGSGMTAFYTLLIGPQLARQDLRSDLGHADILKTYPLAGWQVLLGELLTPAAILTGILWLALLTAFCSLDPQTAHLAWFTPGFRLGAGLGLAFVVPPLCLIQLLVPNAAALLFPAWAQTARTRGGGIDVMGQRLIFMFGQLATFLLVLVPAGLGAFAAFFCTKGLFFAISPVVRSAPDHATAPALLASALAIVTIFGGEIWFGVWWLGERFEKLDIAAELKP